MFSASPWQTDSWTTLSILPDTRAVFNWYARSKANQLAKQRQQLVMINNNETKLSGKQTTSFRSGTRTSDRPPAPSSSGIPLLIHSRTLTKSPTQRRTSWRQPVESGRGWEEFRDFIDDGHAIARLWDERLWDWVAHQSRRSCCGRRTYNATSLAEREKWWTCSFTAARHNRNFISQESSTSKLHAGVLLSNVNLRVSASDCYKVGGRDVCE